MIQITNPNHISLLRYYGFLSPTGYKGFLTQSDFGKGKFRFVCFWGITEGNGFFWPRKTIQSALKDAFNCKGGKVFEFDKCVDLQKWLLTK